MSATVETSIWLALRGAVETLPMALPKAWPGEVFEVPYGGTPALPLPYLRIGRLVSEPVRMLIKDGQPHERTGSLMVTLVYPLGQNVAVYDQLAGRIADHFRDGTRARYGDVCVSVPSYPHVQEGYEDAGYWTVPIRIRWRSFA